MRNLIHSFNDAAQRVPTANTFAPVLSSGDSLLTLSQVAKRLGTSKAWVRDHTTRRSPRIPVVRLGGRRALLRFRPQDIDGFIKSNLIFSEEASQ